MGTPQISKHHQAAALPYHIAAAFSVAVAVSFAAGVAAASPYPQVAAEAHAEGLVADLLSTAPADDIRGQ